MILKHHHIMIVEVLFSFLIIPLFFMVGQCWMVIKGWPHLVATMVLGQRLCY